MSKKTNQKILVEKQTVDELYTFAKTQLSESKYLFM
jgi:hypothetical protein